MPYEYPNPAKAVSGVTIHFREIRTETKMSICLKDSQLK